MKIEDARQVAKAWVHEHAATMPGFRGAFLTGSVLASDPKAPLPPTSDVDIKVVLDADGAEPTGPSRSRRANRTVPPQAKFRYRDVLLEVSYLEQSELADRRVVASTDYLAAALYADSILSDPSGALTKLQRHIIAEYASRPAIEQRLALRADGIRTALANRNRTAPWPAQVMRWLFPTTLTTHLVLNAALLPPTVRKRYVACRQALTDHDQLGWYREFLADLGCVDLDATTAQHHLDRLTGIYDQVGLLASTRFFFSGDLVPDARPVTIGGSQELIDTGLHREAVYWIMATFCRCQLQLLADAPVIAQQTMSAFAAAATDLLGLVTPDDLDRRGEQTVRFMDRIRPLTSELIDTTAAA